MLSAGRATLWSPRKPRLVQVTQRELVGDFPISLLTSAQLSMFSLNLLRTSVKSKICLLTSYQLKRERHVGKWGIIPSGEVRGALLLDPSKRTPVTSEASLRCGATECHRVALSHGIC